MQCCILHRIIGYTNYFWYKIDVWAFGCFPAPPVDFKLLQQICIFFDKIETDPSSWHHVYFGLKAFLLKFNLTIKQKWWKTDLTS